MINKSDNHYVDHIALAVNNTLEGVKWIEKLTGAQPSIHDPEPGQWYWSAALSIGSKCKLEIIGPNPKHKGFHIMKQWFYTLKKPTIAFWYLSTNNFSKVQKIIDDNGYVMERVEVIKFKDENGSMVDYTRGMIGKGFVSERPQIIEWREKPLRKALDTRCKLKKIELFHNDADSLNDLLNELGTDIFIKSGKPFINVKLQTPNGDVNLTGGGMKLKGMGAIIKIFSLYLNYLLKS